MPIDTSHGASSPWNSMSAQQTIARQQPDRQARLICHLVSLDQFILSPAVSESALQIKPRSRSPESGAGTRRRWLRERRNCSLAYLRRLVESRCVKNACVWFGSLGIEAVSMKGQLGENRCPICDHLLEAFTGQTWLVYRLTVSPGTTFKRPRALIDRRGRKGPHHHWRKAAGWRRGRGGPRHHGENDGASRHPHGRG